MLLPRRLQQVRQRDAPLAAWSYNTYRRAEGQQRGRWIGRMHRDARRPIPDRVKLVLAGTGMALVFPTAAETVLASVRPREAGQASGATNAIREIGGVMGVAVLASVFAAQGGYESPQAFTDGMTAALPIAVVVLAAGAVLALLVPGRARVAPVADAVAERAPVAAAA